MIDAFVAYFHYLGIMLLLAALVGEHLLLSGELDAGRGRQLVITAILSVYPKVQIRGMRPAVRSGQAPGLGAGMIRRLKLLVRVELMLIATIPLLAVLMGRGFGY